LHPPGFADFGRLYLDLAVVASRLNTAVPAERWHEFARLEPTGDYTVAAPQAAARGDCLALMRAEVWHAAAALSAACQASAPGGHTLRVEPSESLRLQALQPACLYDPGASRPLIWRVGEASTSFALFGDQQVEQPVRLTVTLFRLGPNERGTEALSLTHCPTLLSALEFCSEERSATASAGWWTALDRVSGQALQHYKLGVVQDNEQARQLSGRHVARWHLHLDFAGRGTDATDDGAVSRFKGCLRGNSHALAFGLCLAHALQQAHAAGEVSQPVVCDPTA